MKKKVLITGANGNLGKKLILSLKEYDVCALVRSDRAENEVKNLIKEHSIKNIEIVKCNYLDVSTIKHAISSCRYIVHLVGIIRENKKNNFDLVHKQTTKVLIQALKDSEVEKVCYISVLGSEENSMNSCFSSRGSAEKLFLKSDISSLIIQVPMVLGEDDYTSKVLRKNALSRINFTFRKVSLEQPIYAGDIIEAIKIDVNKCLNKEPSPNGIKVLAGPTSLTREQLVKKTAELLKVKVKVFSLPLFLGNALATILEMLFSNPPISRAMLGVLDHNDDIDPLPSCKELGIELTALNKMLQRTINS